jgi:hypothetical protein
MARNSASPYKYLFEKQLDAAFIPVFGNAVFDAKDFREEITDHRLKTAPDAFARGSYRYKKKIRSFIPVGRTAFILIFIG